MTKTEVLELIRNGENSGVEFKRDTLSPFQLAKELVALANLYGGRVLLGVESDGTVCGLTRADSPTPDAPEGPQQYAKLEEWVMSTARDKIRPELIPYFEVIREVETGKDVAVIQIDSGWTVHHRWHENHRTYYIRVGTQSREASPEELERLFQARGNFRLELRPVSGAVLDDLDLRRLVDYFRRIRDQDIPPEDARTAWQQLLESTEFMAGEGTNAATVAGVLLFGRDPGRFLPQSGIDAAAY
ncbi:MAG: putative DNA binding domain-containing protein, partial [Candidatus Hydrogenedentes bacterium]|nr:putative DNA binding domain-containing protein [Candidatus Hydrogenedentota bacterium]